MSRKQQSRVQPERSGVAPLKVISASRRTELPGFFPDRLIRVLESRCPPERVQSVVLWSKRPGALLEHRDLARCLGRYEQVFLHLTVTGMGGSFLEPGIPRTDPVIRMIPELAGRLGTGRRMTVRFDPIVHLRLPDGGRYCNLHHFRKVAEAAAKAGVERVAVSWMQSYAKVVSRLERLGIRPEQPSGSEREEETQCLSEITRELGLTLSGCCVPWLPVSSCIDGELLSELHPARKPASNMKAAGQRPACGCTESWDIGWYIPCPGGCLYCYARPATALRLNGPVPE